MPEMNLLYVHANHMGYGRMGTQIARQLRDMGITVYDDLIKPDGEHADVVRLRTPVIEAGGPRRQGRSNVACWISVPSHGTGWWEGQVPVLYTMWEGMRLPEQFRAAMHEFDTIIVPSPHNLELFSQHHDNVKYVPLGIDPEVWHYKARQPVDRYFRFLIAGSGSRKGTDLAVRAFKKVFPDGSWGDGPIPMLHMKNPKGEAFYGDRIVQHGGRYSDEEEMLLYDMAHCYVQPSRGEGFGLQPLQAIARGIPTILTDGHGHASYAKYGIGLDWKPKESDYFIFGDAGDWWEPDFGQLCEAMLDVYRNYAYWFDIAATNAETVGHEFSWRRCAEGMVDAIGRDRLTGYDGPEVWHDVVERKFKIITAKDHWCDIAGLSMFFERGVEYWGLADVKRILFENGILDPACLNDDDPDASGLTPEQIAKSGKYRAEFSVCPTCKQHLNSEARADDLESLVERVRKGEMSVNAARRAGAGA